jgi:hypothetical protein
MAGLGGFRRQRDRHEEQRRKLQLFQWKIRLGSTAEAHIEAKCQTG